MHRRISYDNDKVYLISVAEESTRRDVFITDALGRFGPTHTSNLTPHGLWRERKTEGAGGSTGQESGWAMGR